MSYVAGGFVAVAYSAPASCPPHEAKEGKKAAGHAAAPACAAPPACPPPSAPCCPPSPCAPQRQDQHPMMMVFAGFVGGQLGFDGMTAGMGFDCAPPAGNLFSCPGFF